MRNGTTTSVTILGGGIVGICSALSLLERGAKVRLIDRGAPGQETSFGNAGVISPWSFIPQSLPGTWRKIPALMFGTYQPLSVRPSFWPRMIPWGLQFIRNGSMLRLREAVEVMEVLCAPSIDLYRRALAGTGHEGLIRDSYYVHAFRNGSKADLQSIDYALRAEKGADLALIGAEELRRLEPALSPEFQAAVLIKGQARATSPGEIGRVLAEKARAMGAEVLRAEVVSLTRSGAGWRIGTVGADLDAENVVIAMGAWSNRLLTPLGIKTPMVAERGYHIEMSEPGVQLDNSVMDVDAKFVASSMDTGLRVAGQAEFGPVDAPADPRREAKMKRLAKAAFPDLDLSGNSFWMGRRPSTPDSLPIIDQPESHKGLFLNFGHSHYGLMMAPKSGEVLADLVMGGRDNRLDHRAVSLARFRR